MIIYIDLDDVLCDYSGAFNHAIALTPAISFPQSQYGFYANLEPIVSGIDVVNKLRQSALFEPYILTAPSILNPLSYTEKRVWVEKHFGLEFTQRLIICDNKGLLKGDILIDDQVSGRGQEHFAGELIHYGSEQYPDWRAIEDYLVRLTTKGEVR